MTTDQDPIPVIVVMLLLSLALLCYALTGSPFPPIRF
jgi:hypothetical protein